MFPQATSGWLCDEKELLFFGSAFWAASAPLYLYIKGVFEVAFKENIAAFGIGAVIAAFILLPVYNVVATGNRDKLIAASRTTALLEGVTEERKKKDRLAVSQSGYYALFAVNMLYLVCIPICWRRIIFSFGFSM